MIIGGGSRGFHFEPNANESLSDRRGCPNSDSPPTGDTGLFPSSAAPFEIESGPY